MKTLVIHPGRLGDVIQTVPALRALRADGPVTWAGQSHLAALLRWLDEVDETRVVDLRPICEGGAAPGGYERIVSWVGASHEAYCHALRMATPDALVMMTAPIAGPVGDGDRRPLRVPSGGLPEGPPFTLVQAGSRKPWRVPRPDVLAAALPAFGALVIHQGPGDGLAVRALLSRLARPATTLLHEPSLTDLARWCVRAVRCVGGDTGVTQLAAACGTPTTIVHDDAIARQWAPWYRA